MEPAKRQTDPSPRSGTMGNGQDTESWGYSRFHCQSFLMSKTHIFIHMFCVYAHSLHAQVPSDRQTRAHTNTHTHTLSYGIVFPDI